VQVTRAQRWAIAALTTADVVVLATLYVAVHV